jgi:hypothetical protein
MVAPPKGAFLWFFGLNLPEKRVPAGGKGGLRRSNGGLNRRSAGLGKGVQNAGNGFGRDGGAWGTIVRTLGVRAAKV